MRNKIQQVQKKLQSKFRLTPDKVSMYLNIVSFIIGIIFYARMNYNFSRPEIIQPDKNYEAIIKTDALLKSEIVSLKQTQDSLLKIITAQKTKFLKGEKKETEIRNKLFVTLNNDWDNLTQAAKEDYMKQTILKFKKPPK